MSLSCQVFLRTLPFASPPSPCLAFYLFLDEVSPAFWDDVREQGWFYVDHTEEMTLERYGEWYLPLIDVAMQSFAMGFVGTEGSTYSLVSERRVEDWNGGIVRNVNLARGQ